VNGSRTRDPYVFYTHFNTQSTNIELPELSLLAITAFDRGLGFFEKPAKAQALGPRLQT
jgi:hypothetical protein